MSMSAQTPFTEAMRMPPQAKQVIVVDHGALASRVSAMLGATGWRMTTVPSYLSAMGALAHHQAQVVVGLMSAMGDQIESTAKALRQMAPQTQLWVVDDLEQPRAVDRALGAGFDRTLPPSFDATAWNDAITLLTPTPSHSLAGMAPPSLREVQLEVQKAPSPPQVIPDVTSKIPDVPPDISPDISLGDTDLVEAILHRKVSLREQAMHMIRAQSGLADVAWSDDPSAIAQAHTRVEVMYLGASYGYLHIPETQARPQLEPWAHWLAHWLAMDDQFHRLKQLAMRDELTGAWNRRYFRRFLTRILDHARTDRSQVTLLVFDIDDFKIYNDKYGHAAGDQILSETARLMQSVVREHDVVARIGGDEFAVIFWDTQAPRRAGSEQPAQHPQDVLDAAKRFQQAICQHRFPKLLDETPGTLTISGGLASFPWDGATPDDLLHRADTMALQSKRQGKNAITLGAGAKRACDLGSGYTRD